VQDGGQEDGGLPYSVGFSDADTFWSRDALDILVNSMNLLQRASIGSFATTNRYRPATRDSSHSF
jgi:hypothetical protein